MQVSDIVNVIRRKPYFMRMGANNIASRLKTTPEKVREAKSRIRIEEFLPSGGGERAPKILLLDIETAPLRAYVWGLWKQNIYSAQLVSDWFMLSWAAKWLVDPEVFSQKLSSREVIEEDDSRIITTLWHLLNQADIVIAHNGERFDIPRIKTRFLIHGLPPTTFYHQVDTLKVAKKEFKFSSNKLDALAVFFGIKGKLDTDFTLWARCMKGEEKALEEMEEYNRQDVRLLEEVYIKMRPHIKSHPNYNLYIDSLEPVCSHCGSDDLEFVGYYYFTQTGKYRNYRCRSCGALSRERKTVYKNSKNIVISNGK